MRLVGVTVAAHEKEPAGATPDDGKKADRRDDQLQLALGGGGFRGFRRAAVCLFIVRHCCPPAR